MSAVKMLVTPAIAEAWLASNYRENRKLRPPRIEEYALAMRNGEWKLTSQGIAISEDGELLDGQHRLNAVVQSGCSVWMWVFFGVASSAYLVIDNGMAKDLAVRLGLDRGIGKGMVATARSAIIGLGQGTAWSVSESETTAFIRRFQAEVAQVTTLSHSHHYYSAPVRGAVLRAWFHCDRNAISEFVRSLTTLGHQENFVPQAMTLRDWMTRVGKGIRGGNRKVIYGATTRLIEAFLKGESLSKVFIPTTETWALPEVTQ
jgi:hypothetical protein